MASKNSRPKDNNAPKRPPSAYLLFCKDRRGELKSQHPDWKMVEITKALANSWKNVESDVKQRYEGQANAAKAEYQQTVEEYRQTESYKKYVKEVERWKKDKAETLAKKKLEKDRNLDKDDIKSRISEFFVKYHDTIAKSKYPRMAVGSQYGSAVYKAAVWVTGTFTDDGNFDAALQGFYCLAIKKPNIRMMDFSDGGPHYEINHEFPDEIERLLSKIEDFDSKYDRKLLKKLYQAMEKYRGIWKPYSMADGIAEFVKEFKNKFEF
mmetsp:Transcript_52427/g.86777  ORF Transcript_52427/g.86777 Transcript_52427/m.86777 type:complete len:266 (-) Transcript_52427:114-911(-)